MDSSAAILLAVIISLIILGFVLVCLCFKLYYWYIRSNEQKANANTNSITTEIILKDTQINTGSRTQHINLRGLTLHVEEPLPAYERRGDLTNSNNDNESSSIQIQIHNPGSTYEIIDRPPKYTQ
jgi:archaellum component FlaF (FlaF/FlaG flagellin family)